MRLVPMAHLRRSPCPHARRRPTRRRPRADSHAEVLVRETPPRRDEDPRPGSLRCEGGSEGYCAFPELRNEGEDRVHGWLVKVHAHGEAGCTTMGDVNDVNTIEALVDQHQT